MQLPSNCARHRLGAFTWRLANIWLMRRMGSYQTCGLIWRWWMQAVTSTYAKVRLAICQFWFHAGMISGYNTLFWLCSVSDISVYCWGYLLMLLFPNTLSFLLPGVEKKVINRQTGVRWSTNQNWVWMVWRWICWFGFVYCKCILCEWLNSVASWFNESVLSS